MILNIIIHNKLFLMSTIKIPLFLSAAGISNNIQILHLQHFILLPSYKLYIKSYTHSCIKHQCLIVVQCILGLRSQLTIVLADGHLRDALLDAGCLVLTWRDVEAAIHHALADFVLAAPQAVRIGRVRDGRARLRCAYGRVCGRYKHRSRSWSWNSWGVFILLRCCRSWGHSHYCKQEDCQNPSHVFGNVFSSLGSPPLKHSKCLYLYRVFVFSVWDWFWALQHYTHDTVHWLISGKIVFFDEFTVSLFINIVCSVNGLLACWRTKTTACWSRDFSELIHARAQTFYWLCVVGCLILCSWLMKNRM